MNDKFLDNKFMLKLFETALSLEMFNKIYRCPICYPFYHTFGIFMYVSKSAIRSFWSNITRHGMDKS